MSNSISCKWDLWMVAALVCVAVVLGIYPADRTVWCVEMVWVVGLWAILLMTRRKFRFSTPAYLCFFVWTVLQIVGAHYTFELVPMDANAATSDHSPDNPFWGNSSIENPFVGGQAPKRFVSYYYLKSNYGGICLALDLETGILYGRYSSN